VPRALVVPHAGYPYSGGVAACAFATLPGNGGPLRASLLGPAHFARPDRPAVSTAASWLTPLGPVPVDDLLRADALAAGAVADDGPHRHDHALEIQLPFLQRRVGGSLSVLPVAVEGATAAQAADLVATLAESALVVVSSDLSHYHDAATASLLDRRTAAAICDLEEEAIGDSDACGAAALRGLLLHARRAGWGCTLLDLRDSSSGGGDPSRVVGYGAFALTG
jgi:AmmeMemoRadiSam system protein B